MTRIVYLIETPNAGWDQPYRIGDKREMGAEPWVPKADMDRLREALVSARALADSARECLRQPVPQPGTAGVLMNRIKRNVDAALAALPEADDEGEG